MKSKSTKIEEVFKDALESYPNLNVVHWESNNELTLKFK